MARQHARSHTLTTRITHWAVAASCVFLFGSGAAIYNHRPSFVLGAYRLALPRFPSWLTIGASPKIVHYVFAALFVLCGIVYFAWGLRTGHFKKVTITRADVRNLIPMQLYYLGLRKSSPEYDGYNPLQKLAYSAVLFLIAPLIVLTGAAMLPFPGLHPLGALFPGGVKFWHFGLMSLLCTFVVGHVVMVSATGIVANVRAMIIGGDAVSASERGRIAASHVRRVLS